MADPIWYLGPDDFLVPLVCPERDFDMTPVRYGGIFQGLSGARSMTNTGTRRQWAMDLNYLMPEEYDILLSMMSGDIPGPHRLVSPFHKNLLSPQAAILKPNPGVVHSNIGFTTFDGPTRQVRDWPSAAGVNARISTGWTIVNTNTTYARWDSGGRFPATTGETVTGSVYVKSANAGIFGLGFDWFDLNGVQVSGPASVGVSTATTWTRRSVTMTVPANAVSGRMILTSVQNILLGAEIFLAAAQVEKSATPTAWGVGGGAPRVLIDQLTTKSPRFPYRTASIIILEE